MAQEIAESGAFEALRQTNEHGSEFWSARDLQAVLGYSQWRRFEQAIERAITACVESGNESDHHFAGAGKPIEGGKGAVQIVADYQLSRFACYLIAQNGDPRKPEIARAGRLTRGWDLWARGVQARLRMLPETEALRCINSVVT